MQVTKVPIDTELYHAVGVNHIGDAGYVVGISLFLGLAVLGGCLFVGLNRVAAALRER